MKVSLPVKLLFIVVFLVCLVFLGTSAVREDQAPTVNAASPVSTVPPSTPAPDPAEEPEPTAPLHTPVPTREPLEARKNEEGFVVDDGYLHYARDGRYVADEDIGTLHFNSEGHYTSGNEELDGYVRKVIKNIYRPDLTQWENLELVYNYSRDRFTYLRKNAHAFGATDWIIDDTLTMYSTGYGNCYCYAGVFWSLARSLGYDAIAISGTILSNNQPHSWVEIEIDGEMLIFDPEMEMSHLVKGEEYTYMCGLTYKAGEWWHYVRPKLK